jgi:predicted component of type VI protein secretion system
MIEDFEKYLYDKLSEMQETKATENANVSPNWVTKTEIYQAVDKDMKAILNEWWRAGKIKVHKTIHASQNDYVELIKKD